MLVFIIVAVLAIVGISVIAGKALSKPSARQPPNKAASSVAAF